MKIWQVGSGDGCRDYSGVFLEHDVMLIGPGNLGKYDSQRYRRLKKEGKISARHAGDVRRFSTEASPGDIVLLRKSNRAISLGRIADKSYECNGAFDDVLGWDLQHTRRVIWQRHSDKGLAKLQPKDRPLFGKKRQFGTFTAVNDKNVRERLSGVLAKIEPRKLRKMPAAPLPRLSREELGTALFSRGLANEAVGKVLDHIERMRRMFTWYREYGKDSDRPREHEVVAHLIVPLFLALGWSEQLLAVEWKRIDLAAFSGTPTTNKNCVLVCEAKGMRDDPQEALQQAKDYVDKNDIDPRPKILLGNGTRFCLYQTKKGGWGNEPVGYINIEKIRTNHILPANTNAVDTIMALTPEGVRKRL